MIYFRMAQSIQPLSLPQQGLGFRSSPYSGCVCRLHILPVTLSWGPLSYSNFLQQSEAFWFGEFVSLSLCHAKALQSQSCFISCDIIQAQNNPELDKQLNVWMISHAAL